MTPETRKKLKLLVRRLGKRPRAVLAKLLGQGSVSTYELGRLGYDQPPRAAQDLKEQGVKLRVTYDKHPKSGSRMAIYWLEDEQPFLHGKFTGRRAFSKDFRNKLIVAYQSNCLFCGGVFEASRLQIDHRVPYQIAGEVDVQNPGEFMTLCASHQRTKSWTCEHCPNYAVKDMAVCKTCFWAIPDGDYTHAATIAERRLDILWTGGGEVVAFETLKSLARQQNLSLQDFVKKLLKEAVPNS